MDVGGQVLEGDELADRDAPQAIAALVHGDLVGIDVPRPQRDAGRVDGEAQVVRVPYRWLGLFV